MHYPLDVILVPLQIILLVFSVYVLLTALLGFIPKKEIKFLTPKHRFAILVADHNE